MAFDREALLEEYEDDAEMLTRMVEIFDRDCEQRLSRLRQAVQVGDGDALMAEAHALKGGLGNFFADEAFQTAYELETMGRNQDVTNAAQTLERLESQLQTFRAAIDEVIGK